jgi:Zn finger protein HypA/HybF involved in hydrogenase expression
MSNPLFAAALQDHIIRINYPQKNKNSLLSTRQQQLLRWAKKEKKTKSKLPILVPQELRIPQSTKSLAQRLGIFPSIHEPTKIEWDRLNLQSQSRYKKCIICLQEFKLDHQTLLSCGHIYHANCFRSYENLSQTTKKGCPLCRKEYIKVNTDMGKQLYITSSVIKIQSAWRGYRQFKKYQSIEKIPSQKILLKKYCFKAMSKLNQKNLDLIQKQNIDLSEFIGSLNLKASDAKKLKNDKFWKKIFGKLVKRGKDDCVICCTGIQLPVDYSGDSRPLYITSCSHAFHASCLKSLEGFTGNFNCPICRLEYKRKLIGVVAVN